MGCGSFHGALLKVRHLQLRETGAIEAINSERRRCRWGLYPVCFLNTKEREDIEYLECSLPRGEEYGQAGVNMPLLRLGWHCLLGAFEAAR